MANPAHSNAVDPKGRPQYGGASFELNNFELDTMVPDAYEGSYEAKIVAVKWQMTKAAPSRPMITVELKIISTEEESDACKKSIGSTLKEWIVLANGRDGNMGKQKLRALREALDLQTDISTMNPNTVRALHNEMKNRVLPIWVENKEDRDRQVQTRISYAPPGGPPGPMETAANDDAEPEEPEEPEETDDEPEPAPPPRTAAKSGRRIPR